MIDGDWIKIEKGVRQGYVMSTELFSLYSQAVMNEMVDPESVTVGGVNINNMRHADDAADCRYGGEVTKTC